MFSYFTVLEFTKTSILNVPIQVQYSLKEATKKSGIQISGFLSIFQDFDIEHERELFLKMILWNSLLVNEVVLVFAGAVNFLHSG